MAIDWCKSYREAKGLTQKELAEEMRTEFPWVDESLMSKMANGKCAPTEAMQTWACKCLNSLLERQKGAKGIDGQYPTKSSETADLTPLEMRVYEFLLNTDIDHRITRMGLMRITGMKDRQARDVIEGMRAKKLRIGSGLGKEGYWLIEDEAEYESFIREYSSRAYTVLKNKTAMDNYVKGQIRI